MDLKEFRESLGLSQGDAAKKAKISPAAFCSAELGTRFPNPDTILKIMGFSFDKKTWVVNVTAHDLLATWAAKHGKKVPGAPTSA